MNGGFPQVPSSPSGGRVGDLSQPQIEKKQPWEQESWTWAEKPFSVDTGAGHQEGAVMWQKPLETENGQAVPAPPTMRLTQAVAQAEGGPSQH